MSLSEYTVVIEEGNGGYGAYVPELPGCVAVADTRTEAVQMIHEAIEFHIEGLREEGMEVPEPRSTAELAQVA